MALQVMCRLTDIDNGAMRMSSSYFSFARQNLYLLTAAAVLADSFILLFAFASHISVRPEALLNSVKFLVNTSSTQRFKNSMTLNTAATCEDGGGERRGYWTAATSSSSGRETGSSEYQLPPPEIRRIVDSPPPPTLSFSPQNDRLMFLKRQALPSLAHLAKPHAKLAGIRIDVNCNIRTQVCSYSGIGIHRLMSDGTLGPETKIHSFPDGANISFVGWSPDGRHVSFNIYFDEEGSSSRCKLRIWVADVETGLATPLFKSNDIYVNAVFDNYIWINDSTLLVSTIPATRAANPPNKLWIPPGPKIESNENGSISQARTFQDLLEDDYDIQLFEYYATSQLILASLDGTLVQEIGPPAIYQSFDSSPNGKYALLNSFHRPYSFSVPCWRFPNKVELWATDGRFVRELCDLPLAEDIPIAFGSVRKGMRCINWRADKPSTLYWVETQDGGDATKEVSPRDIIYSQPTEPLVAEEDSMVLLNLKFRFSGILWCDDSLALAYETWHRTRRTRTWVISPAKGKDARSPRILFDRSSEDAYTDPGRPMLHSSPEGTQVVAKVKKSNGDRPYILLYGVGATPKGNAPFLDLLDIHTGQKERVWESDIFEYYETVVALIPNEGEMLIDQLKIVTSNESNTENTQYRVTRLSDRQTSQMTHFPHPYPELKSLQKELIRYKRRDGVQLTATLYLPPGYNPLNDGRLPCLVWSYPEEFNTRNAAGQLRESPNEFPRIGPTSPLLWLARRFAILYNPTIPIICEGNEHANDRFVEQLVASAEAAIEEIVRRGVADRKKIAVGGHSYGAFMAANLLAHAPHLFCCGIARSGAYNRTLTPFGFQNEERTLWEATASYVKMSPLLAADRIGKPLLLIHGEEDNNAGTLTTQSERMYRALKGHGSVCRLVLLPLESHCYRSRESIMHVLWETDRWLQNYCKKKQRKKQGR